MIIIIIIILFDKASYKSASWSGSALAIQTNIYTHTHTHRNDRPRRQVLPPLIFMNSSRLSSFTSRARALSHVAYGLSEKARIKKNISTTTLAALSPQCCLWLLLWPGFETVAKYILNQTTAQLLLETVWRKQIKAADYLSRGWP